MSNQFEKPDVIDAALNSQVAKLSMAEDVEMTETLQTERTKAANEDNSQREMLNSGVKNSEENVMSVHDCIQATKEELKKVQQDMRKFVRMQGNPTQESLREEDLLQEQAKRLKNRLEILNDEKAMEEEEANERRGGNAKSSGPKKGNLTFSMDDVPRFQIKAMNKEYFPGRVMFEDVNSFTVAYELFLRVAGLENDEGWKLYLNVAFHSSFDFWVKNKLDLAKTWPEAKKILEEKFNSNISRGKARLNMCFMKIGDGESVEEYSMRFLKEAAKAGFSGEDTTLAEIFLSGLPHAWYQFIFTNLSNEPEDASFEKTVEQITKAAKKVAIVATNKGSTEQEGKGRVAIIRPGNLGAKNLPFRATNNGPRHLEATAPRDRACRYCSNPFFRGHVCEQYYLANPEKRPENKVLHKNIAVNMASTGKGLFKSKWAPRPNRPNNNNNNSGSNNSGFKEPSQRQINDAMNMESNPDPYDNDDCKLIETKEELCSPSRKILTPIVIEHIKLMAIYPKRVGRTEPLSVVYGNAPFCCSHQFEVVDFPDHIAAEADILLGTDIFDKLDIRLTGIAYRYPIEFEENLTEPQDLNFDTHNYYNPEN
ncbi:hypothetical protein INT47_013070, partial [Mucor saturninus]